TPTIQPTETPIPTPILDIGSTEISSMDGMTLLYVPKSEFLMGSTNADALASSDEKPQHSVMVDAFWIDQTEVTNAMYAKCVAANQCDPPNETKSYTRPSYYGNSEFDNYPVIYVSWNDALAYCSWAGRELPTEAQWEKAARGTDGRIYPWGEDISCDKANYQRNCDGDTSPVKNYPNGVSPYGAYDMAGNVWEWVSSLYQPYPYDANDGREDLSSSSSRVLRGGSWSYGNYLVRSALRYRVDPAVTYGIVGFRCSRSP
ncbi:MAG: formylglycine-generating enzyme family protein, partial [Anaerolineales bacterium]|nr:formylglycine-generating enzyme family protein [Anaerolineales bacterium]